MRLGRYDSGMPQYCFRCHSTGIPCLHNRPVSIQENSTFSGCDVTPLKPTPVFGAWLKPTLTTTNRAPVSRFHNNDPHKSLPEARVARDGEGFLITARLTTPRPSGLASVSTPQSLWPLVGPPMLFSRVLIGFSLSVAILHLYVRLRQYRFSVSCLTAGHPRVFARGTQLLIFALTDLDKT